MLLAVKEMGEVQIVAQATPITTGRRQAGAPTVGTTVVRRG